MLITFVLNNTYRDDYNESAFESSGICFGTVKLSDPSSYVNVRSGASTSASSDPSNPRYNLNYQMISGTSIAKSLLSDGKHLVIVSMSSGHVTRQGHYSTALANFRNTANKLGVKITFFETAKELMSYLYEGRDNCKIGNITIFSHGVPAAVKFGYWQWNQASLALDVTNFKNINSYTYHRWSGMDNDRRIE